MEIIVGKTAGFCYGVKNAVNGALKKIKENEKLDCLGEIVHNKQVIDDLKSKGLNFIDKIEDSTGTTIIRAHGVPKEIYEIARKNNIKIEDYTCTNVLKIHKIIEQYTKKGYYIFLCGNIKHPENIGSISYCDKNYSVIENENDIEEAIKKLIESKIKKVLLIAQTTYSLQHFKKIEEEVKKSIPNDIEIKVENTICKATELRQKETEELSKKVDYMIIIGGKNSSNTKKLHEIAKENCKNSICIETKDEIQVKELNKYNIIGIMAGASTPQDVIFDVIKKIEEYT